MYSKWVRVKPKRRCRICDHGDWCGFTEDGTLACCMRRESEHPARNGGWLHKLDAAVRPYVPIRPAIPEIVIDFAKLWGQQQPNVEQVDELGVTLGVDTDALLSIGCAWMNEYSAFGFPMKDAAGKVIGIRLRGADGSKYAVKGSKSGLFIPSFYPFEAE